MNIGGYGGDKTLIGTYLIKNKENFEHKIYSLHVNISKDHFSLNKERNMMSKELCKKHLR